jgi:hypothetical protein
MEASALRDHAPEILSAVAKDLQTAQTREARHEKSVGRAPAPIDAPKQPRKRMRF